MAPGVDFVNRITDAVADCDVLLVVIGPGWATLPNDRGGPRLSDAGDYVRLEVETALGNPDVTVIPLLVGGARMPRADELPESVQPLSRRNALELSDLRWRHDVGAWSARSANSWRAPATPPPSLHLASSRPGLRLRESSRARTVAAGRPRPATAARQPSPRTMRWMSSASTKGSTRPRTSTGSGS